MPYRRTYKRRTRRSGRRGRKNSKLTLYTRKGAQSQARQIWKNQKQITSIARRLKQTYTTHYYSQSGHSADVTYPGLVIPLVDPASMAPLFNSPYSKPFDNHCKFNRMDLKGLIQIEQGDSVVMCDIFILQLNKDTATQTKADLGNDLSGLTDLYVTSGQGKWNGRYYFNTGNAALEGRRGTMMNPDAFKIRSHRQFMIGDKAESGTVVDPGEDVDNIQNANKPFAFKFNHPIKLDVAVGQDMAGQTASWKNLTESEIEPSKQLYMFISCNAVEGTKLFLDWNMVTSVNEPS